MEKVKIHIILHFSTKKMNNKNKTITQKIKSMEWGIKILKMDH
jgi:hypothetical protein